MPEIIGNLMKPDGSVATELEEQVSQALVDLESSTDINAQLREVYIVGVREIEIGNKSVILVYVPVPQLKQFHKVQVRLVRDWRRSSEENMFSSWPSVYFAETSARLKESPDEAEEASFAYTYRRP